MNVSDFSKQIKKIEVAYNKKFDKDETIMWFQEFQNIPAEEFEKAMLIVDTLRDKKNDTDNK